MNNTISEAKLQKQQQSKNIVGKKFGRLTIISIAEPIIRSNGDKIRQVNVICECGVEKIVMLQNLKQGTKSCGCLHKENLRKIKGCDENINYSHPLYKTYYNINHRCSNPNCTAYKDYGGRGIANEFKSFDHFLQTMEATYTKGLTLDRINVDGNYKPSNCRWITAKEQTYNRRTNQKFIINEKEMCMSEIMEKTGLSRFKINNQIRKGISIETIFNNKK